MTQSPNPNNNNRRRRLTADELIAILVAMSGIGGIFWWTVSHRSPNQSFFQTNVGQQTDVRTVLPLTENAANPQTSGSNKFVPSPFGITPTAPIIIAPNVGEGDSANRSAEPPIGNTPTVMEPPVINRPAVVPNSLAIAPAPISSPVPSFSDVPDRYWGKSKIEALRSMGVLQDFGGGKFDPNQPITRGEYAQMLDRAFADRVVTQQVLEFTDIPASYPRRAALEKSVKMGFLTGYSKTLFKPNEQIPRYQLQISLAKGMSLTPPAAVDEVLAKFGDANKMPKYARDKMAAAIAAGFVVKDGKATKLQPVKAATRGEAATLIYEALVKDDKIKPSK
jgi:S-layer homology domain